MTRENIPSRPDELHSGHRGPTSPLDLVRVTFRQAAGSRLPAVGAIALRVPRDFTVGQVVVLLRHRLGADLEPGKGIVLFCGPALLPNGHEIAEVHAMHASPRSNRLIVSYTDEKTLA